MTIELLALALVALEHLVLVAWSQALLTRDVGKEGNESPRDDLPELSRDTKRLRRALDNHVENFPLFIGGIAIVSLTGANSWFTAACALLYVAARAIYIPAYLHGWVPWRSWIFAVGFLATLALYVAAFF